MKVDSLRRLRLLLLVGVLALTMTLATTTVFAAKPIREAFHLTEAGQISCGWDCDLSDPIIGQDEAWGWNAQGVLEPDQEPPFAHTYLTGGSGRTAFTSVQWKGRGAVTITISNAGGESVTFTEADAYKLYGKRYIDACLTYYPDGETTVMITGDVKFLAAWGSDWMTAAMGDCARREKP